MGIYGLLLWWITWIAGSIVLLLCSLSVTQAADWYLVPSATYRFIYNDNYLLTLNKDREIEVIGHILDVDAKFKYESEKNVVDFIPKVSIRRIDKIQNVDEQITGVDDPVTDYDREDYFLKLNTAHNTKWMDVQFTGDAARDSTELDPEQFISTQALATRKRWNVNPVFIFQMTELTNMNVGLSYYDVRYEDAEDINTLNDYTNGGVFIGFANEISERTIFTLSFNGSMLQSDSRYVSPPLFDPQTGTYFIEQLDTQNETTTYSLQAELNFEYSETDNIQFMLGGRRTRFKNKVNTKLQQYSIVGDNLLAETETPLDSIRYDTGYVLNFEYTKDFESNEWHVLASHFLEPNGAGRLTQRDKLSLRLNHQMLSNLWLNVGLNATRIDDFLTIESDNLPFRVYSTGNVGTTWKFARDWRFNIAYVYRSNYYEGLETNDRAQSHSGKLSITYVPRSANPYEIY